MILRAVLAVLVILGSAGCNEKAGIETEKAPSARGETFAIPVPAGYSVATDERITKMAPEGAALIADKRVQKDAFIGSIVVTRVPTSPEVGATNTEAGCKAAIGKLALAMPVNVEGGGLVETATGKACQWRIVDKENANRRATGTVMVKADDNAWVVTCNYDARDRAATGACDRVLQGFKFD